MTKKYCIFLSALFCAFLGVFLVANAVSPDRTFSQMARVFLAEEPGRMVGDGSERRGEVDDLMKPENKTARYKELETKFDALVKEQRDLLGPQHHRQPLLCQEGRIVDAHRIFF